MPFPVLGPLSAAVLLAFSQDPTALPPETLRVLPLSHTAASVLAEQMAPLAAPGLRIICDDQTNSLILQGSARLVDPWAAFALQLDREPRETRELARAEVRRIFPPVAGHLRIQGSTVDTGGETLLALVARYAEQSGQQLTYDATAAARLLAVRVGGQQERLVAAAEAQGFVERLLCAHDFALIPLGGTEPHLVSVVALGQGNARNTRDRAYALHAEEQSLLLEHPAVLFSTLVPLEHADAGTLANGLRTAMTDPSMQFVAPVGDALLLTGTGAWLAGLVQAARLADTRAGARSVAARARHEVFALRAARADEIGPLLREALMSAHRVRSAATPPMPQGVPMMSAGGTAPASIQVDAMRNCLLVTCDARELEEIRSLITALDRE